MIPGGVAMATLGCRLNQSEGFAILQSLQERDFQYRPFKPGAQIYIVNTCTVTGRSDYKSRQMIWRALKMVPPHGLVVVTGCYSQLVSKEILELGPVHIVTGNVEKPALPGLIIRALNGDLPLPHLEVAPVSAQRCFDPMGVCDFFGHSRAFLKIQEGCNRRCAYCTVWRARGPARSAPAPWIVDQMHRVAEAGYREVVLTGINLGAYKWDGLGLAGLLRMLLERGGMDRLRLSSIEPTEITEELIGLLAHAAEGVPGICSHLHIPLQSGSNRILSMMNRGYTAEGFERLVTRIWAEIPDIFLGLDVMVGFPTETSDDFRRTYELLQRLPVAGMHIFSYSPRPGTKAAEMPQVDPQEKQERYQLLLELKQRKLAEFSKRFLNREIDVLVEGRIERETGLMRALSTSYLQVLVRGDRSLMRKGRYHKVRVKGICGDMLVADLCL